MILSAFGGKNNIIVEGHGRFLAAKKLGIKEIPCIRLDELSDEQRKAYSLAHNKTAEMSTWDFDLLQTELDGIFDIDMSEFGFELNLDDNEPQEIEEDEVPEEVETRCKIGDLWQLGNHRLICGNSTDPAVIDRLMDGVKAKLLLTDPPYNCNYAGKNESLNKADKGNRIQTEIINDDLNDDDFVVFLKNAFKNADNSLESGAPFYIWCVDNKIHFFIQAINETEWKWHQTLIWVKNNFVLGHLDYQKKHEPCLYGWKAGEHYFKDSRSEETVIDDKIDLKKLKKDEMLKLLQEIFSEKKSTSVIYENKPQVNDLHPTMKPIKLLARLIMNSSKNGDPVLDLFGGSGSTLIACEQLNRKCYMCEIAPEYCNVILERWENFTGKKAVKLN